MADDFSRKALLNFLDYLGKKGLMKPATVASRKAAANTFLGILSDEEARDLRSVDLDNLAHRFSNLKGSEFKPASIRVYKSRVLSAFEDLKSYRRDPMTFKPGLVSVERSPGGAKNNKDGAKVANIRKLSEQHANASSDEISFPVPIRPDRIVTIVGIPSDLTQREAAKIANVVMALAQSKEKE